MEKEKNGKTVTKVADDVVLALHAEEATDFVDGNQKRKQNKSKRNDTDGNKMKGKKMRKAFQIGNDVTSTSRDIKNCQCMKEVAEQRQKTRKKHTRSIENDPPREHPSCNFICVKNACAVTTHDTESGSHSSSSFDEVLGSWVRRQKSRRHKKRDNSLERNMETEKTEGTEFLISSASQNDLPLQLPVDPCLKEVSEVNCNAPDVCLSTDTNDAEKECNIVESIPACQGHKATCSTPCLNAKRSIENDSKTEPSPENFTPERNASAVTTHDNKSGTCSNSSFNEVLSSIVGSQKKSGKLEKRGNSVDRNNEAEKSEGTKSPTCGLLEKDLQLSVNSCLKEDSEVNCNALGVFLFRDESEAEKQYEKHDTAESIEICEGLEATCSTPCSNADMCSAADSDGKQCNIAESIPTCQDHEATCSTPCLNAKRSIENDSKTEPPLNNFTPEGNASAVTTHDIKSGTCSSSSFNEVLSSPVGRQKSRKLEKRDISVDRNKETEKSEGTKSPTCGLSGKDLQLSVKSCLKEDSEVNCGAPGVCLFRDESEAEELYKKHDSAESIEICQGLEATCSTPCSNMGNICSSADSYGKPFSEINSVHTSAIETHDDHSAVANSTESDKNTRERRKSTSSYSRQTKIVSNPSTVNSESIPIPDTRSLPLMPVEAPAPFCSKHMHKKEFDEADVRIPSLIELCASRDKIVHNNEMELLSQEGSLAGNSRKKLLVLDINGLLADVVYDVLEGYTPDTVISGRSVFKRPFCDDFLEFCFARFNVGVWSSRMRRNVELILDFLMGSAKHKLLFCWDQSHCTDSNRTTVENRKKPLLVKKLKKLWGKYEPGLPWELGEYNESNTLLLDDSPYKAVCNPPYTAVFPTTYRYTNKEDNSLGPGGELRVYLEGLAMAENVQKYVEENPIGKRPITEKNPSWRFYLDVIRACSSPERSPIRPTFHWRGNRY